MRLAVSNIAWHPAEREAALAVMAEWDVTGLEIAPGLAFFAESDPFDPSESTLHAWRQELDRWNLSPVSMQSLLFGVRNASLFGAPGERSAFEDGIDRAIRLAARIRCPNLVLGSPTARCIPAGMDRAVADEIAADMLRRLGDRCLPAGTVLALESNPAIYGTNFLNSLSETMAFARAVDHPAIRVNFDIGALIVNDETDQALTSLPVDIGLISHVHISEPHLAPAPAGPAALSPVLSALGRAGYGGWTSIEMRAAETGNVDRLRTSLAAANRAMPEPSGRDQ